MQINDAAALAHQQEIREGKRFEFGRNWAWYLRSLDDERIREAESHLQQFLQVDTLHGQTFLDVGSGSGLCSLAARRLGAAVISFDFDSQSVACTNSLKNRYFPNDNSWEIHQGSVLDREFLCGLGQFDIVYAWGVLHHTGAMWEAMENVKALVKMAGKLFVAIYNDCGDVSRRWHKRKRRYQSLPRVIRPLYVLYVWAPQEIRLLGGHIFSWKLGSYIQTVRSYSKGRGMSRLSDIVDWVGGYPYEYANLRAITDFYESDGFRVTKVQENASIGCHQVVFTRSTTCDAVLSKRD